MTKCRQALVCVVSLAGFALAHTPAAMAIELALRPSRSPAQQVKSGDDRSRPPAKTGRKCKCCAKEPKAPAPSPTAPGGKQPGCPCCPKNGDPSCPCPDGCALCNVAKVPCPCVADFAALDVPFLGESTMDVPALYFSLLCDELIHPPRA